MTRHVDRLDPLAARSFHRQFLGFLQDYELVVLPPKGGGVALKGRFVTPPMPGPVSSEHTPSATESAIGFLPEEHLHLLIADDHKLFRSGFKLLTSQLFPGALFADAGDANEAWAVLNAEDAFDLVFLDLAMPGMNGISGVRRFVERRPAVPIVILSAYAEPGEIAECIELGVRGYIPKSASESVFRNAVALVLSGEIYIPQYVISRILSGDGSASEGFDRLAESNPLRQLTPRQQSTLALMIEGHSNKEIARSLDLLESTVKAHVKVILRKLGAHNRTQAALIAADLGWPRRVRARLS